MCNVCSLKGLTRRGLFSAGIGALAVTASVSAPRAQPARSADTPDAAFARLMEGNARYVAGQMSERDFSAGRAARAQGQAPFAAILSCADSRVAPELVFDQGPGELFVVRVAGNFVNDDGLASLEYGVNFLGVPLIVVLGHSGCGAVSATIKVIQEGTVLPGHLPELVGALKPGIEAAIKKKPQNLLVEATTENVRHNVQRLQTADPVLKNVIAVGKLKVVGAYYDIASGKVSLV